VINSLVSPTSKKRSEIDEALARAQDMFYEEEKAYSKY